MKPRQNYFEINQRDKNNGDNTKFETHSAVFARRINALNSRNYSRTTAQLKRYGSCCQSFSAKTKRQTSYLNEASKSSTGYILTRKNFMPMMRPTITFVLFSRFLASSNSDMNLQRTC